MYDGTMNAIRRNCRILLVCFCSCAAAALLLSAWACRKAARHDAPGPDADKQVVPEPPGKCRSDHIKGTCTFLSMIELSDDDPLKPAGTPLYLVSHSLKLEDGSIEGTSTYLGAAKADEDRLRDHYKENSPVACELHKLYPPCAPVGEITDLKLDPPDFATLIDPLYP